MVTIDPIPAAPIDPTAIPATTPADAHLTQLARRAETFARIRQPAEAAVALEAARAYAAGCADGDGKAVLALAESVVCYYSPLIAHAVATACDAVGYASVHASPDLRAECEAWAAWAVYSCKGNYDRAILLARDALAHASNAGHAARARAAFLYGVLWQMAGQMEQSQPWYREALAQTRAARNPQLQSGILRYTALLQVNDTRMRAAAGQLDAEQIKQTFVGLEGSEGYRAAYSANDSTIQTELHRAEMHRLTGRYAEAIDAFTRLLPPARRSGMLWEAAIGTSDLAVCLAYAGDLANAGERINAAARMRDPAFDTYTHAVMLQNVYEYTLLTGPASAVAAARESAERIWQKLHAERAELAAHLTAAGATHIQMLR